MMVLFLVMLDTAFVCTEIIYDRKSQQYDQCCEDQEFFDYCPGYKDDRTHWEHVSHVIHYCSIAILSFFMIEVVFKVSITTLNF